MLVREYPSGMGGVNSSLAAECWNVKQEYIVVGNGAIISLINCWVFDVILIPPITKFRESYYIEFDDKNILVNIFTNSITYNIEQKSNL